MKEDTKKLIEWMKIQLGLLRTNTNEIINNSVDKSIAFLDSLPEIESKLCQGGYIQDKNGTPCCDGDKILFCGEYNGFLRFGFMDSQEKNYDPIPHFYFDFCGKVPTISGSVYFEKVE